MSLSSESVFVLPIGDLEPPIHATLRNAPTELQRALGEPGSPVDLTLALSVKLLVKPKAGGTTGRLTSNFVTPKDAGRVFHTWVSGETVGPAADHWGRFEVLWPGTPNRPQTFPTEGPFTISFVADTD